jgi:tetratricopeptide (TPR) repeat protein
MHGYRTGIILALTLVLAATVANAGDAVTEAKRKAANDLMKEGKTTDAIAMINEVLKADPENYKDHLLLARAYDKLNKSQLAAEQYRHSLTIMLSTSTEDRALKTEVERRLKVLDLQMNKIQAAEEDFLKKLDLLERESISARDAAAVRRVFRLKTGVYRAQERRDRGGAEVFAADGWREAGFDVQAGKGYRVRTVGTFRLPGAGESTADGVAQKPSANGEGPQGLLLAQIQGAKGYLKLGSNGRFVAENSGKLYFLLSATEAEKTGGAGSVTVLIERE